MPQPPTNSRPQRPQPEAIAVGLLPVPDSAPPYDHDTDTFTMNAPQDPPAAHSSRARPSSAAACARASGRPAGDATDPAGSAEPGPAGAPLPGGPGQPEPAGAWPGQFAQVLAETLAGSRAQGQIVPWTSDQARRRIRKLGPMLAAGTVPRVRRVMTTCPAAGVVEMTVVVGFGPRVRALAVRLERDGPAHLHTARHAAAPRWVCTVVEAA